MNSINFLSRSFLQHQQRRARLWRHGAILIIVAAVLVDVHLFVRRQNAILEDQAINYEREALAVKTQAIKSKHLQLTRTDLTQRLEIRNSLTPALTHWQMLALLGKYLPESMNFREVNLQVIQPAIAPASPKGAARNAGNKSPAETGSPTAKPQEPMLQVALTGLAPSDVDVADFLDRLAREPALGRIRLLYSRPTTIGKLLGREFRLEIDVPLNRRFEPLADDGKEVAHAH